MIPEKPHLAVKLGSEQQVRQKRRNTTCYTNYVLIKWFENLNANNAMVEKTQHNLSSINVH